MRALLLVACVLLAGCGPVADTRGPALAGATVEGVTDGTVRLGAAPSTATPATAPLIAEPGPVLHYAAPTAAPVAAADNKPVRSEIVEAFPPELAAWALRTAWCESRWQADAVGDGGRAIGLFQVHFRLWGEVPEDAAGQAAQAAAIVAEHGTWPWRATRHGCDGPDGWR